MRKFGLLAQKLSDMAAILFLGGHFGFLAAILFFGKKMANYHEKSGASSFEIDWVILNLVLGGRFVFLDKTYEIINNYIFFINSSFITLFNNHEKK